MSGGDFHLSEKAVERIAEAAILGVPGSCVLDAKLAGLAGRALPRIVAHVDRSARAASIEADIAVVYPSPAAAVTDTARAAVIEHVQTLTGLTVRRVTIKVANAKPVGSEDRVTAASVAAHRPELSAEPVVVRSSAQKVRGVSAPLPVKVRTRGFRPAPRPVVDTFMVPAPPPLRPVSIVPAVIAHV